MVGTLQQFGVLGLHFAEDAHAQAGSGERMAIHHLARQAQFHADAAHLVFEQFAQRFHQFQLHAFGQTADVVVTLDDVRLAGLACGGLDHIGVNGPLCQPFHAGAFLRLFFEYLDE